jgi:hypothetical protein
MAIQWMDGWCAIQWVLLVGSLWGHRKQAFVNLQLFTQVKQYWYVIRNGN